jgi:hypothetical protein
METKISPPPWISGLLFFLRGIVQGIYVSGGPIIVYAAGRLNLAKAAFRSTLCALSLDYPESRAGGRLCDHRQHAG